MTMWRTLKPLSKGFDKVIPRGSVTGLEWVDEAGLERLQRAGAITPLSAPPLNKLPNWAGRSKKLRTVGIETVEQFLEADFVQLSEKIHVSPRTLGKWKDELLNKWLAVPGAPRRR